MYICFLIKKIKMTQKRTSDFLDYDYLMTTGKLLLENPKKELIGRYIIIAVNTGLRCSDILALTFEQLREPWIEIIEKKTKKDKKFSIHKSIHELIKETDTGSPFLTNRETVITNQYLNRELKKVFANEINAKKKISTHTFRKSFGREIFKKNNESDFVLIKLSKLFNHKDASITRTYLGITQEEIDDLILSLGKK